MSISRYTLRISKRISSLRHGQQAALCRTAFSALSKSAITITLLVSGGNQTLRAQSNDWGYDDGKTVRPQSGPNIPSAKSAADKNAQVKPPTHVHPGVPSSNPARAHVNAGQPEQINLDAARRAKEKSESILIKANGDKEQQVIHSWLQLYALMSPDKLTEDQLKRFSERVAKCVNGKDRVHFEAILTFWPLVQKEIKREPEQGNNFRDLFRALSRVEMRTGEINPAEAVVLSEVLGPQRIAVPGDPALYEDAVEAYADMACFMYAENHPGKTIDALDNRTIFASVIYRKFKEAPSLSDKLAMANFALKWSKFKILYADANEVEKAKLVQRISGMASAVPKMDISNAALDAVLTKGPWVKALNTNIELQAKPVAASPLETTNSTSADPAQPAVSDTTEDRHN